MQLHLHERPEPHGREGKAKSGFVWYELMTNNLDKAVAFYGSVVGWDVRDSGMPGMRYMLFGKDGKDVGGMMSVGIHRDGEAGPSGRSIFLLRTWMPRRRPQ